MPAAADGNLQPSIASESQRGEDIGGAGATGDEGGTSADRPIPDRADLFVAFIERAEQPSGKAFSELLYVGVDKGRIRNHAYGDMEFCPLLLPDATSGNVMVDCPND
jgi:hypothetical protein